MTYIVPASIVIYYFLDTKVLYPSLKEAFLFPGKFKNSHVRGHIHHTRWSM